MIAKTRSTDAGIALVTVLWMLTLLTTVAMGLSMHVRSEAKLARNLLSAKQARYAAEGGVQLAIGQLLRPQREWQGDGAVHELRIGDADIRIAVQDEAGKIDLNLAMPETLGNLFAAIGVESPHRDGLVDEILDWRDPDSLRRLHGAEDNEYLHAGRKHGAKDGKFDSVDELQMLLSMTPLIFEQIRHSVTVYSRQTGINPGVASAEVLRAVSGLDASAVDEYIEERNVSRQSRTAVPALPTADKRLLTNAQDATFTVTSNARLPDGAMARVTATVAMRQGEQQPFTIVDWSIDGKNLFGPAGENDGNR